MEKDSGYVMYPEKVLSLITATAQKTADYTSTDHFDEKVGAGMIDLQRMFDNSDECVSLTNYCDNNYTYNNLVYQSETFQISTVEDIQISVAWLAHTDRAQSISEVYVTDYDLLFVNEYNGGIIMADSVLTNSNVELIRYTFELSGPYHIEVRQRSSHEMTDYLAVTYVVS